ncbi:MAG: hypothetical protein M2R45_04160 [Verrucomicrobia subdivision 3 bacterium]|nr:hypothetical protein [Limisphaerales bacterium]
MAPASLFPGLSPLFRDVFHRLIPFACLVNLAGTSATDLGTPPPFLGLRLLPAVQDLGIESGDGVASVESDSDECY